MEHISSPLKSGGWVGDMLRVARAWLLTTGTSVVAAGILGGGILGTLFPLLFAKVFEIAADMRCGLVFQLSRGATAAATLLWTLPVAVTSVVDCVAGVALAEVCSCCTFFNLCSLFFPITSLHSGNSCTYALKEALFWLSGVDVVVSFRMPSTRYPAYPKAFSITHLNVCPRNAPNCISYSERTSVVSCMSPPLLWTPWTARFLTWHSEEIAKYYQQYNTETILLQN